MEDGISQVIHINAGADDHVAIEPAVFLEVYPPKVIIGELVLAVVSHRHRHIHYSFFHPAIPIAIHVIVRTGVLKSLPGGGNRRGIPSDEGAGLFDPGFGFLEARIDLAHHRADLIAPPLLELRIGRRRLAGQTITGIVARDAGWVVALVAGGEADVVVMDAVKVEVAH